MDRLAEIIANAEHQPFDEQLKSSLPVAIEKRDESYPWLVSVGGLNQRMGMPVHEFVGVTKSLDVPHNRLFVRDSTRLWYQKGLEGITDNFWDTGQFLGRLLDALGAGQRSAIGSSAGGFACLGWTNSARFDRVLTFSPQSAIGPTAKVKDQRWLKFIWKSWLLSDRCLDVAPASFHSNARSIRVVYPRLLAADRFQAERIQEHGALTLDGRDSADHSVVREIKKSGELIDMLSQLLSPVEDRS